MKLLGKARSMKLVNTENGTINIKTKKNICGSFGS